ncbi:hypothetical protein ACP70R_001109 [Stipagrostis hirtigluma subsp. patula]
MTCIYGYEFCYNVEKNGRRRKLSAPASYGKNAISSFKDEKLR